MRRRLLAATTLTPVGVLGVAGVALAFWTVASTGATGTASADALSPPRSVSTSGVTFSSVTINVTAGPTSGPTPTSYRVDRTGPSSVSGVCSISGTTGSCNDPSPVQGSTNTYAVFSKLGDNWVSATSATTSAAVPDSDTTAPTTIATPSPAANGAGWNNANLSVQLAATDNSGGSGVKQITYAATGAQTISTTTVSGASASVGITAEGTTTLTFFATDNANNVESTKSVTIKLDKTGPANVLTLTGATGNQSFLTGSTAFYNGGAAGSFQIRNALTDGLSGPASSATASLAGTTTGWTHSATTVSTPTGGPYTSGAVSWAAATTSSPTETLIGRDVADNTTLSTLTFTNDVTGPTGGSVTYANANSTSSSVSVGFAAGTDAGAGVNAGSALLQRSTAAYVNGACQSFDTFSTIASAPSSSPFADTLPNDGCFKYQYVISDNVGNTTTYTSANVVIRDTTAPTVTINQAAGQADPTNSGTITFTALFSEPVTGFTNTDITIGGTAGGTKTAAVTGTGPSYTVTISGATGNGTITATIPANAAQDTAGNNSAAATSTDNTVTLDTSAPTAVDVQASNGGGNNVVGRIENGDTLTYTFSEGIKSNSVFASWTGGSTPVFVRVNNNAGTAGNDTLTVFDSGNTSQYALGVIDLGRSDYVTANVAFGAGSGSNNTTISLSGSTITINVGSVSGTNAATISAGAGSMIWTPSSSATDIAGNPMSTVSATEGGSPDKEF